MGARVSYSKLAIEVGRSNKSINQLPDLPPPQKNYIQSVPIKHTPFLNSSPTDLPPLERRRVGVQGRARPQMLAQRLQNPQIAAPVFVPLVTSRVRRQAPGRHDRRRRGVVGGLLFAAAAAAAGCAQASKQEAGGGGGLERRPLGPVGAQEEGRGGGGGRV